MIIGEVSVRAADEAGTVNYRLGVANLSVSDTTAPNTCAVLKANNKVTVLTISSGVSQYVRNVGRRYANGRHSSTGFFAILPPNGPTCGNGGQPDSGRAFITASSYHPGGVYVVMCDGSIRFVSDTIDVGDQSVGVPTGIPGTMCEVFSGESPWGIWGALGSINGKGTKVGRYNVGIIKDVPEREPTSQELELLDKKGIMYDIPIISVVPKKYNVPQSSGLTANVVQGKNAFNFELKTE